MDTHDPLCPCGYANDHSNMCRGCQCDRLAKARADERERIENKIYANCYHTKYVGVKPCQHDILVHYLVRDIEEISEFNND